MFFDLELFFEGVCYLDMFFEFILRELYCIYWYDVFFFLLEVFLSFVDLVIDIFILVLFYEEGYKIWFGVGLVFVILFCFVFLFVYYFLILSVV